MTSLSPISQAWPSFDLATAYEVLAEIGARRQRAGWTPVGRKIGFTNFTIWPAYGVDGPMWAPVWDRTVEQPGAASTEVSLGAFTEPRIEPEVVFKLAGPVPVSDDPVELLRSVEWLAAGFEIVRCPYPGWKFTLPDCTAAFGLHGRLVIGEPVAVEAAAAPALAGRLATFGMTLRRDGHDVASGAGANVLGSPARALGYLSSVLADQPQSPALAAGEVITTGTLTDAQPVVAGEVWTSDYSELGLPGLTVAFRP